MSKQKINLISNPNTRNIRTITKHAIIYDTVNSMDILMSYNEYTRYLRGVETVNAIFPHLTTEEREFLISGLSIEEQAVVFKPEEEDEAEQAIHKTKEHLEQ